MKSWLWAAFLTGWFLLPEVVEAQFTFTTNNGAITITGYAGNGGAVAIPDTLDGYAVTGIGDYAFENCNNLTSITIGNGITNVGAAPFLYCSSLTNITVDANNQNYSSINGVLFNESQSTLIQYPAGLVGNYMIPSCVTSIGGSAFCSSRLTSIMVPGGVTNIGYGAFAVCSSLTNAIIADGVVSLGATAFADTALTEITIPASITAIGLSEFAGCTSLTAIIVDTNNPAYRSEDGVLFNKAQSTLVTYPAGASANYRIPASVAKIGDVAFVYSGLTNLTIPSTVRSIGINAFGYSDLLTNVTMASGVEDVGELAFYDCRNLVSACIPSTVTNIGDYAFSGCDNLLGINIPGSVSNIGQSAFIFCESMTNVLLSDGIRSIGYETFANCLSLTNIVIPESVTNIGTWAFTYCTGLIGVYFEGSPPAVGSSPWSGDDNVIAYYLPTTSRWNDWSLISGIPVAPWLPQVSASTVNFGGLNNQFGCNINWARGQTVVVEACNNLVIPDWEPIQTMTLTNDTVRFTDPQWTNFSQRFYRFGLP